MKKQNVFVLFYNATAKSEIQICSNKHETGPVYSKEACIGVLGIQDICHFTSRNIGYFSFYFQGYGILCSIFGLLSGILNILEN